MRKKRSPRARNKQDCGGKRDDNVASTASGKAKWAPSTALLLPFNFEGEERKEKKKKKEAGIT